MDIGDTNIIMGGNFNCIIDTSLDKHSQKAPVNNKSSAVLKIIMHSPNLVDIWRLHNPTIILYSIIFYSIGLFFFFPST